jgi:hypothetical protein
MIREKKSVPSFGRPVSRVAQKHPEPMIFIMPDYDDAQSDGQG